VKEAAWGCDWVGTPVPFQRCLVFIITTANKEFTLTAGKFVPVSNVTMMNVSISVALFSLCLQSTSKMRSVSGERNKNFCNSYWNSGK
jgi:hypothetical protein